MMTIFYPNFRVHLYEVEKYVVNTPEAQFLHDLSSELWISGFQEELKNSEMISKLHYLSGFVSFRPNWHGVYAEVIRMVEEHQRTVKIPNDINVGGVIAVLNKLSLSFTIKGKHEICINPFADIHDDLLAVLTGMKNQVDNLGDFSNKLQGKLVELIGKAENPDVTYKSCLQKKLIVSLPECPDYCVIYCVLRSIAKRRNPMEETTTEKQFLNENTAQVCDQEMLDNLYRCAWNLYQRSKLEEANVLFQYLCLLRPLNKDYQMGLGATHQLKKQYHRAIEIYMTAAALAENDYRPLLQLGYCHLMIKKNVQARECFEEVCASTSDPQLKLTAQGYLSAIDNVLEVNH